MKTITSIIKKALKYISYAVVGAAIVIGCVIAGWETVRPTVVGWYGGDTVITESVTEPATEFELYVASQEVQEQLQLMFMKHQRKLLDEQIAEKQGL